MPPPPASEAPPESSPAASPESSPAASPASPAKSPPAPAPAASPQSAAAPAESSAASAATAAPAAAQAAQGKPNALLREQSPYLQQHAYNPVGWQPWGAAAFAEAQRRDCLVLVSIGYATCHWCHVMERESFEDPALAEFLNAHFVAIKVDREERPDVDRIYMEALQAMEQQGGWPLNMFTTPDGRPVAGGTYFPPQDSHGRKGFRAVLAILADAWQNRREDVLSNARALTEYLQQRASLSAGAAQAWDAKPIQAAVAMHAQRFDARQGGFRLQAQNKFPPSMGLRLLLRQHARSGEAHTLHMVEATLQAMLQGGIYDQLGGGLHRYSTDYAWHVPHFEKMLYDNALLASCLVEAHQASGKALYRAYAEDVLDYLLRDLRSAGGAFCSAEDADSEGREGQFYVWAAQELSAALPPQQAAAAIAYWGVQEPGEFEGSNILRVTRPLAEVAQTLGCSEESLAEDLQEARGTLLALRARRPRPLRDDKVLTSWNALALSAFARAGWAFADASYTRVAQEAAHFLWGQLRSPEGRLLRRWRAGEARLAGYLVDYAQLAAALLELYQADFDPHWMRCAQELMAQVNVHFRNPGGPYYETGADAEALLVRSCEGYDGVEPSGNSSAALAFLTLHAYGVQGPGYQEDALRIFASFREHLQQAGMSFCAMLGALDFFLGPPQEIALIGEPGDKSLQAMLELLRRRFAPNCVLAVCPPEAVSQRAELIPLLAHKSTPPGKTTAYVCQNMACKRPVTTPEDLRQLLG